MVNSPKCWKDAADSRSCEGVADGSDGFQVFRESAVDCSAVYRIDIPTCILFGIAGSVRRNEGT